MTVEIAARELKATAWLEGHELSNLIHEFRRSVRRESHHLELVTVVVKSEVLGDRSVKHAERVRIGDLVQQPDLISGADCRRGADEIPEAVDCTDGRVIER